MRIDNPTSRFGEVLRNQVEERLTFFESGAPPSKNADAMKKAFEQLKLDEQKDKENANGHAENIESSNKKKKQKRKSEAMDVDDELEEPVTKKRTKEEKEARKLEKTARKLIDDTVSGACFLVYIHKITFPGKGQKEKG